MGGGVCLFAAFASLGKSNQSYGVGMGKWLREVAWSLHIHCGASALEIIITPRAHAQRGVK